MRRGYKQTEAGIIPEDWDAEPLGRHAAFRTGPFGSALHKADYVDDGVPVINPMHIDDGRIVPSASMMVSLDKANTLFDFKLKSGEIVIGRRGEMGRCAVVEDTQSGWLCGTGSMIIRPTSANPYYLQRVLSSPSVVAAIENTSVGTTMVNLNQGTLAGLQIQFPPLLEQSAIASALSDVDALLSGLGALIAKKRDIKQAAMQQLLTGQTRLKDFSGEWEIRSLGDICIKIQDGTHFSPKLGGNDYLYVTSKNIGAGRFDASNADMISAEEHAKIYARCDVRKGDLLLTKDGANTGNAALNPLEEPFSLLSSVALLRFDDRYHVAVYFLYQILSSDGQRKITDLMSGNAITRLTLTKIRALRFPVPQVEEQRAIAAILSDMDAELASLEARRDKTRLLKQGMMQELLTGTTRLV